MRFALPCFFLFLVFSAYLLHMGSHDSEFRRLASAPNAGSCIKSLSLFYKNEADSLPEFLQYQSKEFKILRDKLNEMIREGDRAGFLKTDQFLSLVDRLPTGFFSIEQNKLVSEILERRLTERERKIIYLVSVLGKYSRKSGKLLDLPESYSWGQFSRKVRLLDTVGFSKTEKRDILWYLENRTITRIKDLFKATDISTDVTRMNNDIAYDKFMKLEVPKVKGKVSEISSEEAVFLYKIVKNNPVASLRLYDKYKPIGTDPGFCWGRAIAAQIEALSRGISEGSIKKVFAVGDLESGSTQWRYHVSTLVRSRNDDWIAIDPIMGRPMTLKQWIDEMDQSYNTKGNMRIFFSDGDRYGPSSDINQIPDEVLHEFNNYFYDLVNYFHTREQVVRLDRINEADLSYILESEVWKIKNDLSNNISAYNQKKIRDLFLLTGAIGGATYLGVKGVQKFNEQMIEFEKEAFEGGQ